MTGEPDGGNADRVEHLHLDPLGGISGDMFLAALLDAWPRLSAGCVQAMRDAGLPAAWSVDLIPVSDHGLTGTRLTVTPPDAAEPGPPGSYREIRRRLEAAPLPPPVRHRAIDIFARLAAAESEVHGVPPDEVRFHEIAGWDSIADIVGAAHLIEALGGVRWSVGPLPLGRGRVDTAHGPLPVPAPATVILLRGLPVIDDGVEGERVTPTGAAILASLDPGTGAPAGGARIVAHGYGFGSRRFPALANSLRVLGFAAVEAAGDADKVGVLRFEIDDQTPEDLAIGLGRIAALDPVRDVCQWPAYGKKGRLLFSVQVLCDPDAIHEVAGACLAETTTIGLRWRVESRQVLRRSCRPVSVADATVSVKSVARPGGRRSAKAAADDVARAARGQAGRAALARRAQAAALGEADE